jgi:hypothetical protein
MTKDEGAAFQFVFRHWEFVIRGQAWRDAAAAIPGPSHAIFTVFPPLFRRYNRFNRR